MQTDTGSYISILVIGGIESLEHFRFILILDAHARVCDNQRELRRIVLLVIQFDGDGTVVWRELEGIGQEVHHNLIGIVGIDKDIQMIHIMYELIIDAATLGICRENIEDVLYKAYEFDMFVVQKELTLLYLAYIHHLVDEPEDTLGVLLNQFVFVLAVRVLVH